LKTITLSTGNIALRIPAASNISSRGVVPSQTTVDEWTVDIPGFIVRVTPYVRLNFPHDEDLAIAMVSPPLDKSPITSSLAFKNGSGANFGSGANNCSGTPTKFSDNFIPNILDVAAPFAQTVGPIRPWYLGIRVDGTWKITVTNYSTVSTGTVGCVKLLITYEPL
jgi:subtilisin-like proprotein convertase family protein